ncbi:MULTISPECIES: hypothetical protein [Mesorhizobium]|uniref:Uncharacterized protein n=2 Tax=Mesorhizobium ciceri TaxID=39645 RepID=E8T9U3_MESCW|nr:MULTISPECIES: hypothetical protein [Mesorhizobium]RUZ81936.1 hypothetical protein EN947_18720 [Mesorhizobium sp. M7A.F.Ca.US.003.02.2.1]RVB97902.1 hypothetical protein EN884_37770 [Mesorhizobium sp. M7A.F.Ca.AU.001.01.1.1]ADV11915.1 hypothetical protein Mesci_2782 [Mesorhizobium ciceri biovar biserrulae WSM1271]MDF3208827.1 hypothetical protein [Mesorhizobium sp. LMG15046]MDF3212413.1 hypothetical protein [Mesorhizobium ciceri]
MDDMHQKWPLLRKGLLMSSLRKRNPGLHPSDLQLCQRVFDRVCLERKFDRMSGESDVQLLAATVFSLFQNGCRNEGELLESFRRTRQ